MSKASTTQQLRLSASRAQGYAAAVAAAAAEAIEELDNTKAERPQSVTATLAAAGWSREEAAPNPDDGADVEQTDSPFPFFYDITAQTTAADQADVYVIPDSMAAARACGFCTITETLEGKIRVRAQLQPDTDIRVECSITKGVTQ